MKTYPISMLVASAILCSSALAHASAPLARAKITEALAKRDAIPAALAAQEFTSAKSLREEMKILAREGQAMFKEAAAADAADPALLVEYGMSLELTEDFDLAAKAYRSAVALDASDASVWLKIGRAEARLGDSRAIEAKTAFERCLRLAPGDALLVQAYAGLGDLFWRFESYDIARVYLQQVLSRVADDVPTIITLAALHAREGDVVVAADALDAQGTALVAHTVLLRERLLQALTDFERNRVWFADVSENHLAFAKLLFRVGRPQAAVLALERSLDLDAGNYVVWNLLGSFSREAGDTPRARQAFERSIELHPDQPRTREAITALNAEPQQN